MMKAFSLGLITGTVVMYLVADLYLFPARWEVVEDGYIEICHHQFRARACSHWPLFPSINQIFEAQEPNRVTPPLAKQDGSGHGIHIRQKR